MDQKEFDDFSLSELESRVKAAAVKFKRIKSERSHKWLNGKDISHETELLVEGLVYIDALHRMRSQKQREESARRIAEAIAKEEKRKAKLSAKLRSAAKEKSSRLVANLKSKLTSKTLAY